jgi:hypothetical protein
VCSTSFSTRSAQQIFFIHYQESDILRRLYSCDVSKKHFSSVTLPRRIFGVKRDKVTEECGKLHIEELNDLYCSSNIFRVIKSRRMRRAGHVARMGDIRGIYRVVVAKPAGKTPLGRPRRRCEDNIKMDL